MPAHIHLHIDMTIEKNKRGTSGQQILELWLLKPIIKLLLSKWGILSVDMQRAIQDDQKVYSEDGSAEYADNKPDLIEPQDPFQITDGSNDGCEDDAEEIDITQ